MAFLGLKTKSNKNGFDNAKKDEDIESDNRNKDDAKPEKIIFPKTETYLIIPTMIDPKKLEELHEELEELIGRYLNL